MRPYDPEAAHGLTRALVGVIDGKFEGKRLRWHRVGPVRDQVTPSGYTGSCPGSSLGRLLMRPRIKKIVLRMNWLASAVCEPVKPTGCRIYSPY